MSKWRPSQNGLVVLLAVGIGLVMHYTTPDPIPFVIVGLGIVYYGDKILQRLASLPRTDGFGTQIPDTFLTFRIDDVVEEEFRVRYVDAQWDVGRTFCLYGEIIRQPEGDFEGLRFEKRAGIKIHSTANWFRKAQIGSLGGPGGAYISLPYQLARHVLEDVRRDKRQLASIGFNRLVDEKGKVSYPVCHFELIDSLD